MMNRPQLFLHPHHPACVLLWSKGRKSLGSKGKGALGTKSPELNRSY